MKTSESIESFIKERVDTRSRFGLYDLDQIVSVHAHDLICLAGRQKVGKTSIALFWTLKWIREGKTIAYFSNEMRRESILCKMAGQQMGMPTQDIMEGNISADDMARLKVWIAELESHDFRIYDGGEGRDSMGIATKYHKANPQKKPDIIIIDNLHQLTSSDPRIPRHEHVRNFCQEMRLLTTTNPVAVIMVCHCNRDVKNNKFAIPTMFNIAESDSIGRDVDIALLLSWPWKELQRIPQEERQGKYTENQFFVNVGANRYGPDGLVELSVDPVRGTFGSKLS